MEILYADKLESAIEGAVNIYMYIYKDFDRRNPSWVCQNIWVDNDHTALVHYITNIYDVPKSVEL